MRTLRVARSAAVSVALLVAGGVPVIAFSAGTAAAAVATAVLYVDNTNANASDATNCQTLATPCKTIGHAVAAAEGLANTSATIAVLFGTYTESVAIDVPSGSTLTIAGSPAGITVTSAGGVVFDVQSGSGAVTLSHLAITGSSSGGLVNDSTVTLIDDNISNDNAPFSGYGASGGGLVNAGAATLYGDTFAQDGSSGFGGGGGIENAGGTLTAVDTTFRDNTAGAAGGADIWNYGGGTVVAAGDTFVYDQSTGGGGFANGGLGPCAPDGCPIYLNPSGTATVIDDTFTTTSPTAGEALFNNAKSTALVENSTFSGNAGMANDGSVAIVEFDTFANNASTGLSNDDGWAGIGSSTFVTGGAGAVTCSNSGGGVVDDLGYNVSDNSDCLTGPSAHDVVNAPDTGVGGINLGALQNNGGPTLTRAIGANSAAWHLTPAADCHPVRNLPEADQRGVPRPQPPAAVQGTSAFCDTGAYEFAPPAITGVSPPSGPAAGGTSVNVTGYGFTLASTVRFGTQPAHFTVHSDGSITATAPPGTGTVDVSIANPDGSSPAVSADRFTYTG